VIRRLVVGVALVLAALVLPAAAYAQTPPTPPPLEATLSFVNPPANLTFSPTTPIKINLLLRNVSGAPILTLDGFSSTEFWRLLYFDLDGVGTITDGSASLVHGFTPFGTCHYRNSVLLPGAGIQVVPVEVLATSFARQFNFDDVRTHFDLLRPGRYTVNARITFVAYDAGAVITDCNIEFSGQSLLSIGDNATVGRQQFSILSNSLEFIVPPTDSTAPTTTVVATPAPNGAGWNNQNVTLAFTATDNAEGAGVNRIEVVLAGAQNEGLTLPGASGNVVVTTEGVTTVTYNAVDNLNNVENAQSLTVRIDKTAPAVTPPASITVAATEAGGARASASAPLAAFLAAGSATDNLGAPVRLVPQIGGVNATDSTLVPIGTTIVTFRFQDAAGNIGTATANVTVIVGTPAISATVTNKGVHSPGIRFYDVKFTNSGNGLARTVRVNQIALRTLSGTGTVTYNSSLSPALPVSLGDLAPGASATIRIYLNVPSTVTRFSITENGQYLRVNGATLNFSTSQAVFP
jgi:hypothetical protein